MKSTKFGSKLRELREANGLLLRQVAACLEIDTAHICKLERGERKAKREQVIRLASVLKTDADELLALWLADQMLCIVQDEKIALDVIKIVNEEVKLK